jgi:hypothetical protein
MLSAGSAPCCARHPPGSAEDHPHANTHRHTYTENWVRVRNFPIRQDQGLNRAATTLSMRSNPPITIRSSLGLKFNKTRSMKVLRDCTTTYWTTTEAGNAHLQGCSADNHQSTRETLNCLICTHPTNIYALPRMGYIATHLPRPEAFNNFSAATHSAQAAASTCTPSPLLDLHLAPPHMHVQNMPAWPPQTAMLAHDLNLHQHNLTVADVEVTCYTRHPHE